MPRVDESLGSRRHDLPSREQVSVVIPFYDQHETLCAALASIDGQAGVGEVIIVDDASAAPPEPEGALPVTVIRHGRNRGPAAARNTGVAAAKNPLIAFLDADDQWLPGKTEAQVAALSASGAVGCLSGYFILRRREGQRLTVSPPSFADGGRSAFLGGWIGAAGSTLMIGRDVFLALGGYEEGLRHYEDWDLLLRASREGRFTAVERPLSLTVQIPSGPGPHQAEALERLAAKHRHAEHGGERRRLEAALAYERASMHYRSGRSVSFLTSLLEAVRRQPLHTARRAAGRLFYGTP